MNISLSPCPTKKLAKPKFSQHLLIAAALSAGGALLFSGIETLLPSYLLIKLIVAAVSFVYALYLLTTSKIIRGKLTLTTLWFAITISTFLFDFSLVTSLVVQALLLWGLRGVCRYRHLLPFLLDGGVIGVGMIFALWGLLMSGSVFLTFWCFYLVQSLHSFIPNSTIPFLQDKRTKNISQEQQRIQSKKFHHAALLAQRSIQQLSQS